MATANTVEVTPYAKKKYNLTAPIEADVTRNYSRAIVAIASADGKLAQEELDWFVEEQRLVGIPSDIIEENIIKYDGRNANIEELLGGLHYDFPLNVRRCILYQAIKMSRADGIYNDKEKAAVAQAAQVLGIERNVVISLESLVEIEESADRLRLAMFETDVQ